MCALLAFLRRFLRASQTSKNCASRGSASRGENRYVIRRKLSYSGSNFSKIQISNTLTQAISVLPFQLFSHLAKRKNRQRYNKQGVDRSDKGNAKLVAAAIQISRKGIDV